MKKGFTLSEILIVLVIIGVLSALTLPGIVGNTQTTQRKAAFKKAFSNLSNAYALEFATKPSPSGKDDESIARLKNALNNNLNVKYYVNADNAKVYEMPDGNDFWYVAEDNIAYQIVQGSADSCAKKLTINEKDSSANALDTTCLGVTIDVDCIGKGKSDCGDINDDTDLDSLNGNRIKVFVSSTGIATGNPDKTISGKILSND